MCHKTREETCDVCKKVFQGTDCDRLAICHVPGKQAGRVCEECRLKGNYRIVDPNHPEFLTR